MIYVLLRDFVVILLCFSVISFDFIEFRLMSFVFC